MEENVVRISKRRTTRLLLWGLALGIIITGVLVAVLSNDWQVYSVVKGIFAGAGLVIGGISVLTLFIVIVLSFMRTKDGVVQISKGRIKKVGLVFVFGLILVLTATLVMPLFRDYLPYRDPCSVYPHNGCVAIEYHAAQDIYEREDVAFVIKKYKEEETFVVPLNYAAIEDKDYLRRILPEYVDQVNIHCVIWAQTPEWNRFFLEDGDAHHEYIELSEEELLESLANAFKEDQNAFWMNFRPKIDFEEYK